MLLFLTALVALLAGLVQGLSGFGSALVALPLLSLILDVKFAIPIVTLLSLAIGLINYLSLRQQFDFSKVMPLLIGSAFGIPIGVYFLRQVPQVAVQLPLAALLVAYAIYNLFQPQIRGFSTKYTPHAFGFFSGCLGGAFSINGPPALIYVFSQSWPRDEKKLVLAVYFLLAGILIAVSHAIGGLTTPSTLLYFVVSLPGIVLGTMIGIKLYNRMSHRSYSTLINVFLIIAGFALGYQALAL